MKSASLQYANALADIALEQGAAAPVMQQLGDFTAAYSSSAELRNFFDSPRASKEAKRAVAEKIFLTNIVPGHVNATKAEYDADRRGRY